MILFIRLTSAIVNLNIAFLLIYIKNALDIGVEVDASVAPTITITVLLFYYIVSIIVIVAVWKWFGFPRKVYTGQLNDMIGYMFPSRYVEDGDEHTSSKPDNLKKEIDDILKEKYG